MVAAVTLLQPLLQSLSSLPRRKRRTSSAFGVGSVLVPAPKTNPDELDIDLRLVKRLVATQFPQWADLPLTAVPSAGTVLSYVPVVPKELLNSFGTGGPGSEFVRDVDPEAFLPVADAFTALLRGQISWDAANSPVL
jgi:hypothetical protein